MTTPQTRPARRQPRSAARAGGVARRGRERSERPLGNTADASSTAGQRPAAEPGSERRRRRAEALAWRARLWEWTSLPRLRNCGRVTHSGVGGPVLRLSDTDDGRRAGLAGLQSCGSPWACPVCARRIAAERAAEVRAVLGAVADAGGCAYLVTLTMRHHSGHGLDELWRALSTAWGAVTSGRAWEAEQTRWGVLGWMRAVEATHGAAGWHLHVHAVLCFDGPVSGELAAELGGRMFARWERALGRRRLSAVEDRGGLDLREVVMSGGSLDRMADYLAKITSEITSPSTKEGRGGNRAPFAILRDALATGLADDIELWWAWERASHGRKQLTWSRNLRTWAGLRAERSDEQIAADDALSGPDLLVIPPAAWPAVRREVADLLDAAELGGIDAAIRWLTSRGLPYGVWGQPAGQDG